MKELKLAVGLMSGTSLDGVDAALVEIAGFGLMTQAKLKHFISVPFSAEVSAALLHAASGKPVTTERISHLNFLLGTLYSEAVLKLCKEAKIETLQLDLIGSHGQTVFHQSEPSSFCERCISSTLQIGEASIVAEKTGVTTVSDFRPRDMAAGGKGAPLIPYVDYLLFRDSRRSRILLNVGGIANITAIPASAKLSQVTAFDTGPGNMVIDAIVRHYTRGDKRFDSRGSIASSGQAITSLLDSLLEHPFFAMRPPKTAGREQFGESFVAKLLSHSRPDRFEDLVSTATELTARTICDSISNWARLSGRGNQLIVSGGGARNDFLLKRLRALLPKVEVLRSDDFGIPATAKEAMGFAILANETLHLHASNVPTATGARHPVVLGKVVFGANYKRGFVSPLR